MTDTQAQEAARLADAFERSANWLLKGQLIAGERAYPLAGASDFQSAAALLRSQAARIAELDERAKAIHERLRVTEQLAGDYLVQIDGLRTELARMREPLSDEQVQAIINTKHFDPKHVLRNSDLVCLSWYRLGLRDGEAAHGITKQEGEPHA